MSSLTPDDAETIEAAMDQRLESVFTNQVARVLTFNADTRTATIQPLGQIRVVDEFGDEQLEDQPPILEVPVLFMGGGAAEMIFDVQPGDLALIAHTYAAIGRWKHGTGETVNPFDHVRHQHSECVAVVGLQTMQGRRLTGTGVVIGYRGGAQIQVTKNEARIGGQDANEAIVAQSALDFFGLAIISAIASIASAATPDPSALHALQALQTALGTDPVTGRGWDAGTSIGKVK